jgi:hypothetical protein
MAGIFIEEDFLVGLGNIKSFRLFRAPAGLAPGKSRRAVRELLSHNLHGVRRIMYKSGLDFLLLCCSDLLVLV